MTAAWNWFVSQNGVKDIVATIIGLTATRAAGWHPRKHQRTQEQIADRLDTSTPGGITDLIRKDKPGPG